MKTYYVCSDHFNDSDYNKNDFNVMKLLGYEKRMRLRLNPEAVPNTHLEKDDVSAIRERFPNPDGIPHTGYISLKTNEGHNLP